MIFRAGFLLVALISAITVGQTNLFRARKRSSSSSHSKHGNCRFCGGRRIGKEDSRFDASHDERRGNEEKAETCGSESALEGISDKPENFDSKMEIPKVQENSVYEINHLKKVVEEMEQRRENLELGLIELYCSKEQNSRISHLQKELKDKIAEIDILKNILNKLQSEREVLYKEVKLNQSTEKQLESAGLEILELQLKMEFDAGRMNEHLVRLKEQVRSFFDMDETSRKDTKSDQKLRDKRKVELEALKMKRRNKELQLEKRELGVKLDSVEARISELSNMTEDIVVGRIEEETKRLKGDNHHLTEKIEELHKNRFSILEELVYQRRLNSCLRFEILDHQSRNMCRKLSFLSEDESRTSSELSSTDGGTDEFTNSTTTSFSSSPSVTKSKILFSQIFNIKKWGSNDFSPDVKNRSFGRKKPSLFRRFSMSSVVLSTNSGQRNKEIRGGPDSNSPETPLIRSRVRRVSFNDSLNSVAYIRETENNDQSIIANTESFSDWSDIKTSSSLASTNTQEKKTEMASEEPKISFSGDLNIINQDFHSSINNNKEIKTEIELNKKKEITITRKFGEEAAVNLSLVSAFSVIIFLFIYFVYYFSTILYGSRKKFV